MIFWAWVIGAVLVLILFCLGLWEDRNRHPVGPLDPVIGLVASAAWPLTLGFAAWVHFRWPGHRGG